MKSVRILLSALCVLLVSCGNDLTEILVVVDSDLAVPMGLDAVRVDVSGVEAMSASGTLTGADAEPLPRTVGIVHSGGSLGPLTVTVVGSAMGTEVVSARAVTSFVRGRTLVLPIFLSRRCVGVSCGNGETCARGSCGSADVDPVTLAEWSGTVMRPDGGACTAESEICNGADDDCDGRIDEDFDLMSDPRNCGACLRACSAAHAAGTCAGGACIVGACDAGFGDCNADPTDGCETDLSSSATNCGTCGHACSFPNASGTCSASACGFGACNAGFGDCNSDVSDGCEVALTTLADCGACGATCEVASGTATCATGTCEVGSCDPGLGDCNADPSDGCEATLDTLTDCGACGTACTIANGTPTCATGACAVEACDSGFDDCNGDASDGCEAPLDTLTDCGACGMGCSVPSGTATCATGTCAVDTCPANLGDCNGDPTDGCETDLRVHPSHCGACGASCDLASGQPCVEGKCLVEPCKDKVIK